MILSFTEKVFRTVKKIPRGKISTYQVIARAVGRPKAARAVGNALNKSPGMRAGLPANRRVPCHRVIRSDGSVGGYAHGTKRKLVMLRKEGIVIRNNKVDLVRYNIHYTIV